VAPGSSAASPLLQLRRLTLAVTTSTQLSVASRALQLQPSYHLIALRPLSEEVLQQACEKGDFDVISLPLEERLPFPLRGKDIAPFLSRGGFFEIELAPALRDSGQRRTVLQNVGPLLHATRGKNVFVSSGAAEPMEMRSPRDLANFATVAGLRGPLALQSVTDVPYRLLQRAALRRGHTQAVLEPCRQLQEPAKEPPKDVEMEDAQPRRPRVRAKRG